MFIYFAKSGEIRTETYQGREHKVIPVIGLVEGVLQAANSAVPELIPACVMAATSEAWNGRPVIVDHPKVEGKFVSANSPEVLEQEQIGTIFNAQFKDDKKLFLEAWIDVEAAKDKDVERINDVVKSLEDGEKVEVSTGFFGAEISAEGEFEGKVYKNVITNIVSDHLAILSDSKGACSLEDGCGANRFNQESCSGECQCGGACKMSKETSKEPSVNDEGFLKKAFEAVAKYLKAGKDLSGSDRWMALGAALEVKDGNDCFSYVYEVFDDYFVYYTEDGLFRRAYEISEDGSVTLGDEIERVRPETEFVPVKVNKEATDMDKTAKVSGLIANAATRFNEANREWLLSLEEEQLDALEPTETEPAPEPEQAAASKPAEEENSEDGEGSADEPKEPVTAEQYINDAPEEVQEVLKEGINRVNAAREDLVSSIKSNPRNKFSDDELKGFSMPTLENLAELATTADFSGRGGPRANQVENTNIPPTPPALFPKKAAANE